MCLRRIASRSRRRSTNWFDSAKAESNDEVVEHTCATTTSSRTSLLAETRLRKVVAVNGVEVRILQLHSRDTDLGTDIEYGADSDNSGAIELWKDDKR